MVEKIAGLLFILSTDLSSGKINDVTPDMPCFSLSFFSKESKNYFLGSQLALTSHTQRQKRQLRTSICFFIDLLVHEIVKNALCERYMVNVRPARKIKRKNVITSKSLLPVN